MQKQRLEHIDFLRALGIISIIVIHVLSYHLVSPLYNFFWNYLHFDVVLFVFCSGYVLTAIYRESFTSVSKTLVWYKKRFIRLYLPYLMYLIAHYLFLFALPNYFSGLDLQQTSSYILSSVFLTGGVNGNWLVLLFIQLTFLFPFLSLSLKKKKMLILYAVLSIITTMYFTIVPFSYSQYRSVMWIPWSFVLLGSMFLYSLEQKLQKSIIKICLAISAVSFGIFLSLYCWFSSAHRSLTLIDHKYPPDFYYLLYATSVTLLLFIISNAKFLRQTKVKKFYTFISKNSYQLYFVHYIVLDFVFTTTKHLYVWSYFIIQLFLILMVSLGICYVIAKWSKSRIT